MAKAAAVTIDLETRTSGWSKGLDGAGKELKSWAKGIQGELKGLTFDAGKNFSAGGAANFANALATVSKGAADVATQLRTGASYADTFKGIVDKIPIVGQFRQAGEAIRELVTGEQAARVEAQKQRDAVIELVAAYQALNAATQLRGKYGYERAAQQIENEKNRTSIGLANERETLKTDVMRFAEEESKTFHWHTDAERAENSRKIAKIKELESARQGAFADSAQAKVDLDRAAKIREDDFQRESLNNAEMFEAQMVAKSLKAQGRALEGRIVMIQAEAKVKKRNLDDALEQHNIEEIKPELRAQHIAAIEDEMARAERDANDTAATAQAEFDRRQQEESLANQEKLAQIQAAGNIERLKIEDERINAFNEKHGIAMRSHLAEAAEIEEAYQKEAAALEKKFREDNRTDKLNYNDPTLRAGLVAADEERFQKLGVLGARSDGETLKNQTAALEEQRRLWERVGDPMQKYAAHLAEINENFEKFHDTSLRQAELHDLDKNTFAELKRLNPDHETSIQLYGRTGSYADVRVGGGGMEIARQQLDLMKQQAAASAAIPQQVRDIWDYFRQLGLLPELNI